MKHIALEKYTIMGDDGMFRLPVAVYRTYCGKRNVGYMEIDNEHPTCEDCMDAKTWEEIDAAVAEGR